MITFEWEINQSLKTSKLQQKDLQNTHSINEVDKIQSGPGATRWFLLSDMVVSIGENPCLLSHEEEKINNWRVKKRDWLAYGTMTPYSAKR